MACLCASKYWHLAEYSDNMCSLRGRTDNWCWQMILIDVKIAADNTTQVTQSRDATMGKNCHGINLPMTPVQ